MSSRIGSTMDFSTFVNELNQSPQIDYENAVNRNCYPPETRLSQDFESRMQRLLSNYDLDEMDVAVDDDPPLPLEASLIDDDDPVASTSYEPGTNKQDGYDSALSKNDTSHDSLDTTVDNALYPLELTSDDFVEDSGDGGSSDEQEQSPSLSLSYSLSVSHAQENISQSTDKGLSKRYDSPCSYEDDRESECTNFDKLDDWNDLISDLHNNNNNNAENTNRDFRDYYEDFLAVKAQSGTAPGGTGDEEASEEGDSKSTDKICDEVDEKDHTTDSVEKSNDLRPDTPAPILRKTMSSEKSRSFLEYRNPLSVGEQEMLIDDNSNSLALEMDEITTIQPSGKRKFAFEDREDYEYEISTLIVEKFHKTDVVPDRGCHPPISLIDDETFAKMTQVESPSKTPIPKRHESKTDSNDAAQGEDGIVISELATTPTNNGNIQQMFLDEEL